MLMDGECVSCTILKVASSVSFFLSEYKPEETFNQDDGLRRRNVSVLTPLYHQDEEEEAEEEQFRHPQREGDGDIGFTLNKCIFGALILLGLGTIFFSGNY